MEAIIKRHNYEDLTNNFVKSWENNKNYKFLMGSIGFWDYILELSGKDLLCYKNNYNILGSAKLITKHDTRKLTKDDFETVLYDTHLECLCAMIYE